MTSFKGRTGAVSLQTNDVSAVGGALLAGPNFSGVPTAPTAAPGTSTTQLATCAFVAAALFAVITTIPVATAQALWALASVASFAVACHLALKLAGARPSRTATAAVAAAGLALEPVYHTLFNGQINTILLAFVLADLDGPSSLDGYRGRT